MRKIFSTGTRRPLLMISCDFQVDISGVDTAKFEDAYFAKSKAKKVKSADGTLC
jgi:hypothetical protein